MPLSRDLRERILYKRYIEELTYDEIAEQLVVSKGTAHEIVMLFEATGDIESLQGVRPGPPANAVISRCTTCSWRRSPTCPPTRSCTRSSSTSSRPP